MKKEKKNPEQETEETAQEQETETGTEETTEETQEQEEVADTEEETEEQAEETEQTEETEDTQDTQEEAQQETAGGSDEAAGLRQELLHAQGKLAAYAAGVAPGMIDDAVTLAMAEASKAGEITEAAVTKAMEAVLKRHPEWKAEASNKSKGGFKLGADRDSGGSYKKQNTNTTQNVKRWNRFK